MLIEKAQESLHAAELCYNEKLYNSTANRAYYAMFQAAVVALSHLGIQPNSEQWSHENLQATFVRELIHQRKLLPRHIARYLQDGLRLRLKADYKEETLSAKQAQKIMRWSREFMQLIEGYIGYGT